MSAVAYVLLCSALLAVTGWRGFVVLGVPVVAGLAYAALRFAYGVALLALAQYRWASRGLKCLLVHSESPVWQEHIAREWLPRLGQISRSLNWSDRSRWGSSLEVRLFRRFCVAEYNFNPAVLVFRGLRAPVVFRFFYAFHEAKGGRPQYLQELEGELFSVLGAERGGPTRR